MLNKESVSPIKEEPYLRTSEGKIAVLFLSAIILSSSAAISELTKPKPNDPFADYDPNSVPTVVSLPESERHTMLKPIPIPDIPSIRDIKHVFPEDVEKWLEEEGLTSKKQ